MNLRDHKKKDVNFFTEKYFRSKKLQNIKQIPSKSRNFKMFNSISFENSPFREVYIPFSYLIIAISIEIIVLLFYRSMKYRHAAKYSSYIFLAFGILLLGYTIGFWSLLLQRFFLQDYSGWEKYFYVQAWFFMGTGVLCACIIIEKIYQKSFKTRYLFSIISACALIINLFNLVVPFLSYSGLSLFILLNFFLIYFLIMLIRKSSKKAKLYLYVNLIGFILYVLNFMFANQDLIDLLPEETSLIVFYVLQFVGSSLLFYGFYRIPTLDDLDWKNTILEFYIIHQNSNPMAKTQYQTVYYYNFHHPEKKARDIYAGGIVGIQLFIDKISRSGQKVRIIKQNDFTIIFEFEKQFTAVLTVSHSFRIHSNILKHILSKFIEDYGYVLETSMIDCSNISIFDGFNNSIREILYLK
jgi:hypothetical protein